MNLFRHLLLKIKLTLPIRLPKLLNKTKTTFYFVLGGVTVINVGDLKSHLYGQWNVKDWDTPRFMFVRKSVNKTYSILITI